MNELDFECCSVCFRRTGVNDSDDGSPPVDLGRCAASGGFECRAVAQAVDEYRRENAALRANSGCHAGPNHGGRVLDRGAFGVLCSRCLASMWAIVKRPRTFWGFLALAIMAECSTGAGHWTCNQCGETEAA